MQKTEQLNTFFENLPPIKDQTDEVRVLIITNKEKILDTLLLKKNTFEEFKYKLNLMLNKNRPESLDELGVYLDIVPKSQVKGTKIFMKRANDLIKRRGKIWAVTSLLLNSIRGANSNCKSRVIKVKVINLLHKPYLFKKLKDISRIVVCDEEYYYFITTKYKIQYIQSLKKANIDSISYEIITTTPVPGTKHFGNKVILLNNINSFPIFDESYNKIHSDTYIYEPDYWKNSKKYKVNTIQM